MATWENDDAPKYGFINSDGRNGFFWQVYGNDVAPSDELELPMGDLERFDIIILEVIIITPGASTNVKPDLLRYSGDAKVKIAGTDVALPEIRDIGPLPVVLSEQVKKLIIKPNGDATVDRLVVELTVLRDFRSI